MSDQLIELVVDKIGTAHCIYSDEVDLTGLGEIQIHRASAVEPDSQGRWWADLAPVSGPKLGPFCRRSQAIKVEVAWLRQHWLHPTPPTI